MVENVHMSVWKTIQDMNYVHASTGTENLLELFTVNLFQIQLAWDRFSGSNKCRCTYLCTYVCIYVSMYVCMYICMCVYVFIYVGTYVCMYICICKYIVCMYVNSRNACTYRMQHHFYVYKSDTARSQRTSWTSGYCMYHQPSDYHVYHSL
jgi:hypothetical protein